MTLFERLRRDQRSGSVTTLRSWLRAHPPRPEAFTQTIAGVATRTTRGEPFMPAVREFLDEFDLRPPDLRDVAIAERPPSTGDPRFDAFLAGLAEHLSLLERVDIPLWALEPERFLDRFWFVSDVEGFRAITLARAPAAFRRRGVLVHPDALVRV